MDDKDSMRGGLKNAALEESRLRMEGHLEQGYLASYSERTTDYAA